ncbi:MAG: FecR domain-containing protein [Thermoanaerobaculia bacterium]|nr:FecR domain-containing protein [Thermoanaerobaculia bacterium]
MSIDEHGSAGIPEDDLLGRLLQAAGPRPAVPDLEELQAVTLGEWQRRVRRRRRRVAAVSGLALAASLALVLLGSRVLGPTPAAAPIGRVAATVGDVELGGRRLAPGDEVVAGSEIVTADAMVALRLGTAGSVRLAESTRLRIDSAESWELLAGAVYVDRRDAGSAHVLRTAYGDVTPVGPRFEVSSDDERLRVAVREGLVVLANAGRRHQVASGSVLAASADGEIVRSEVAAHDELWAWTLDVAPPFRLEGATLAVYLDWLTRETGLAVSFAPDVDRAGALETVLHGSLEGRRPDRTPELVLPTCGLAGVRDGGELRIAAER